MADNDLDTLGDACLSLAGQTALVTGASRGIGAATAEALARAGAHVVLVARDARGLEAVEARIHAGGGSATLAPLDLAETDAVPKLAAALAQRWQRLDILVLSAAAFGELTSVVDIDQRQFASLLTTNVLATQALLAQLHPLLRQSTDARVIGLTSAVARVPRAFWGAYGASKAAFAMLLECYALEVRATAKVRVAIVDPGATRTKMRARAYPGEDPARLKSPEVVAARLLALLSEPFASPHHEVLAKA